MTNEKLSKETTVSNANALYGSLSESDKMLISAMANTMFALFQSVRHVQAQEKPGTTPPA